MDFKLNINLTDKDYQDLNVFLLLRSKTGADSIKTVRKMLFIFPFLISVIFFDVQCILREGLFVDTLIDLIPMWVIFLVLQLLVKPLHVNSIKNQIKAHKKNGKVLYWPEEVVVVSDECITEITPEVKTEYFYSFIERVNVVGHDFVFIQMKSHSGVIIPVRCFESGEQYSKFIDFIKTKSNNVDIIDC